MRPRAPPKSCGYVYTGPREVSSLVTDLPGTLVTPRVYIYIYNKYKKFNVYSDGTRTHTRTHALITYLGTVIQKVNKAVFSHFHSEGSKGRYAVTTTLLWGSVAARTVPNKSRPWATQQWAAQGKGAPLAGLIIFEFVFEQQTWRRRRFVWRAQSNSNLFGLLGRWRVIGQIISVKNCKEKGCWFIAVDWLKNNDWTNALRKFGEPRGYEDPENHVQVVQLQWCPIDN